MNFIRNKDAGFTMVEIIVVLIIVAILVAIVLPSMSGWIRDAEEKSVNLELRTIAMAVDSAYTEIYVEYNMASKKGSHSIYYSKDKPSSQDYDISFAKSFEKYLRDDVNPDSVSFVNIVPSDSGNKLFIGYIKGGTTYRYSREADGSITITSDR